MDDKNIKSLMGKVFLNRAGHPIFTVKNLICDNFPEFSKLDGLSPVVSKYDNFDGLLIPEIGQDDKEFYNAGQDKVLRTNVAAHWNELLSSGYTNFIVSGDVYCRGVYIDRFNHSVKHQVNVVSLSPASEFFTYFSTEKLLKKLYPNHERKSTNSYATYLDKCHDYHIKHKNEWLNVATCGNIKKQIIENCGLNGESGWSICFDVDRMAMAMFDIPDVRILWRYDDKTDHKKFLLRPSVGRNISFWTSKKFDIRDFHEAVRSIGNNSVESLYRTDVYDVGGKTNFAFRVNYRSVAEEDLSVADIDAIQDKIKDFLRIEMCAEVK